MKKCSEAKDCRRCIRYRADFGKDRTECRSMDIIDGFIEECLYIRPSCKDGYECPEWKEA